MPHEVDGLGESGRVVDCGVVAGEVGAPFIVEVTTLHPRRAG
jgi:hypothetical protein